jgi:hypothetical protein
MAWITSLPASLQLLIICALLITVGAIARFIVKRWLDPSHLDEEAKHADSMLEPIETTLALLIGFAITITWSGVSDAQIAIEAEAVSARQVAWSIIAGPGDVTDGLPREMAVQTLKDLTIFLNVSSAPDAHSIAAGLTEEDQTDLALRQFQRSARKLSYASTVAPAQAASIQSAADALAAAEADSSAIAGRQLPNLFIFLIFVTALLLAALQGVSLVKKPRPWAVFVWALIVALSITVVLQMDSPYTGDISVSRQSLSNVAARITAELP